MNISKLWPGIFCANSSASWMGFTRFDMFFPTELFLRLTDKTFPCFSLWSSTCIWAARSNSATTALAPTSRSSLSFYLKECAACSQWLTCAKRFELIRNRRKSIMREQGTDSASHNMGLPYSQWYQTLNIN